MGINLEQLQASMGISKEFIAEENEKLDKKFEAQVQALCSLYNGELSSVSLLDSQVGLQDGPIGTVISYMGKTAPTHYLACDGTIYNITDYPLLADHFKKEFGTVNHFGGDGTSTFAVPDLRGEFLRGSGANSHTDQGSGGEVGVHQDATAHVNSFTYYDGTRGFHVIEWPTSGGPNGIISTNPDAELNTMRPYYKDIGGDRIDIRPNNRPIRYASRPTNTSILYCIKAEMTCFCNVEAQANVFDTTKPVIIGVYNGKYIYRRTIEYTFTPTASGSRCDVAKSLPYTDIGKIINMYGSIYSALSTSNHATCALAYPYVGETYNVGIYHNAVNKSIYFVLGSAWSGKPCSAILVIEYLAK